METRFTTPPWSKTIHGEVVGADLGDSVCMVLHDYDIDLIVAAPALYEALACAEDLFAHTVGMMTFSGDGDNQSRNEGEVHRILKEMRAALALARGEHPESRVGLDPDAGTRQHGEK